MASDTRIYKLYELRSLCQEHSLPPYRPHIYYICRREGIVATNLRNYWLNSRSGRMLLAAYNLFAQKRLCNLKNLLFAVSRVSQRLFPEKKKYNINIYFFKLIEFYLLFMAGSDMFMIF